MSSQGEFGPCRDTGQVPPHFASVLGALLHWQFVSGVIICHYEQCQLSCLETMSSVVFASLANGRWLSCFPSHTNHLDQSGQPMGLTIPLSGRVFQARRTLRVVPCHEALPLQHQIVYKQHDLWQ